MKINEKIPAGTKLRAPMSTKADRDSSSPVIHIVEADFSGCTVEHIMGLAMREIKVLVAGKIRKKLNDFPAGTLKANVSQLGNGGTAGVVTDDMLRKHIGEMTDAELAAEGLKRH